MAMSCLHDNGQGQGEVHFTMIHEQWNHQWEKRPFSLQLHNIKQLDCTYEGLKARIESLNKINMQLESLITNEGATHTAASSPLERIGAKLLRVTITSFFWNVFKLMEF